MTQFENLKLETASSLAILTINRPKVLNALNAAVLDELMTALGEIRQNSELRAVVVTGAGERAFVAGADVAAMAEYQPAEAAKLAEKGHKLGDLIAALPLPVIAAVNGFALGGGLELALACDVIYASKSAKLGQPEVNLGVIPGFGGTQRLIRRVGPGNAARMIFSGDPISAEEALRIGLIDALCEPAALLDEAQALGRKIASRGPLAVGYAKRALRATFELPLSEGNLLEQRLFAELFATHDQKEGMGVFLAKRPPAFLGK
jgi:enoyl-CoA hydratase